MNTRLARAVRFGCRSYLKGVAIFCGSILLAKTGSSLWSMQMSDEAVFTFSFWGIASLCFLCVLSSAGFRENQRMFVQNGSSRRTGFLAELITLAITAAVLALIGEGLTGLLQVVNQGSDRVFIADLYQMFYHEYDAIQVLTLGQHVTSGLFIFCLLLFGALFAQWFSVLFWRLNKFWTIVVVICLVGLTLSSSRSAIIGQAVGNLVLFILGSPWWAMLVFLLAAAFFATLNWCIFRNTILKARK